jgi:multimeric flavodoxin WrbA
MKIIVLNGSPKGKYSITLQYANFLQKKFSQHTFRVYHVSQLIKKIEKDRAFFDEIIRDIDNSDAVIWSFGLWVLAVPAQYMRFIELISERKAGFTFEGKYAAAISTSIQFFDHTAHNYMRAVCEDLHMRFTESMSFYILDFMKEEKRQELTHFFESMESTIEKKLPTSRHFSPIQTGNFAYEPGKPSMQIETSKKILVLTDNSDAESNLGKMIRQFRAQFLTTPELINLHDIDIKGACIGCMTCGYNYKCHYKDGFEDFYNNTVRAADILVFAGEMKGRYLSSTWKTFFDRAFFWNHTPSLKGKQIAYLISGPFSQNLNLSQILEGNVCARQHANLLDIVSDEHGDSLALDAVLQRLAEQAVFYSEKEFVRPRNFLREGGHKIFRDEIFGHIRGVWQADHRYYRKNGLYDFEQKKTGLRIMNFFLLTACKIPSFRKKYYSNIKKFPAKRFGKELDKLFPPLASAQNSGSKHAFQ